MPWQSQEHCLAPTEDHRRTNNTRAFALAARLIAFPTCPCACWTLGPVKVSHSTLDASYATFASANPNVDKGDVVYGRSTGGASRDWFRALHDASMAILPMM